jgi:hypothetical protein
MNHINPEHSHEVDRLIAGLWDGEISEARFADCASHAGLTAPQIDALLRELRQEDSLS